MQGDSFRLASVFVLIYNDTAIALQGWYIGITAASQAVKAGSIPVPCSKNRGGCLVCCGFLLLTS